MAVQVSGTNARFLKPALVLSEVMRIMEPNLIWLNLIPFVDTGGLPIVYGEQGTASSDALKQTPRVMTPSSGFPEVEISRMTKKTAITKAEGLSVRFDKSALTLPSGVSMIRDSINKVAYWLVEYLNAQIYATLDAGSTDSGITVSGQWSAATSAPQQDLDNFVDSMIREGYPYRMSDVFIENANFKELKAYMAASERPIDYNAVAGRPKQDMISMPGGYDVHRVMSSVTHGDMLGIDAVGGRGASALYYNNDSMFMTPATVSYETVVGGSIVTKSVPNFGLSTHQYFEDATHDTVVQLWIDQVTKVKDAYGIVSENGI